MRPKIRTKAVNLKLTPEEHDRMKLLAIKYHTTISKLFRLFITVAEKTDITKEN